MGVGTLPRTCCTKIFLHPDLQKEEKDTNQEGHQIMPMKEAVFMATRRPYYRRCCFVCAYEKETG